LRHDQRAPGVVDDRLGNVDGNAGREDLVPAADAQLALGFVAREIEALMLRAAR
jgi:hypothetical protein